MAERTADTRAGRGSLAGLFYGVNHVVQLIAPAWLTLTVLRVALAVPFWRSGILKWDGFLQLDPTAILLFTSEFKLQLPGGPYSYPAPAVMAFLVGSAEIALPILLVLGVFSRLAALGLLVMTIVVELTIPSGWPVHITWAAMALAVMAWGAGPISLDRLLEQYLGGGATRQAP